MKKLILLALVCTGFAVTTPFTAQAIDSDKIAQYVGVASPLENRDQNRNDQNRDNQNRNDRDRDRDDCSYLNGDSPGERLRQRVFLVYYRSDDDSRSVREASRSEKRLRQRRWMYVSKHCNRRAAERAANRLERRGYRIQILG